MCSSSAKFTMIWKLVGAALGSTNRASSAGMPAATASRYTRVISAISPSNSFSRPASRQESGMTNSSRSSFFPVKRT